MYSQTFQYHGGNDNTMPVKAKPDFFNQSPAPGKLNKLFGDTPIKEENGHAETTGLFLPLIYSVYWSLKWL